MNATSPPAPAEQFCVGGEVRLCYQTFGDPTDPTVLLVMGLGMQMLGWDAELCQMLAARLHVVRYDNRDCGRSTHLTDRPAPSRLALGTHRIRRPAYTLADMAGDAVGLLDHLGVDATHVVGASMGGMIAQTARRATPGPGALTGLDHVRDRQPALRSAVAAPLAHAARPAAQRRARLCLRADDSAPADRLARVPRALWPRRLDAIAANARQVADGSSATEHRTRPRGSAAGESMPAE